ncbi:MAP kinase-activated protein kinase 3 [Trichoplax sp. H2]|nr:MAP kinase-activated protein kinase 3 [Trichoplax sp. H2]|eukprot:RDD41727.1 MAP kinase-activated protein kinase 3 [Trichoplax sp. H2]
MAATTPRRALKPKRNPITDDYVISKKVLGLGVNGKVLECTRKGSNEVFALKILKSVPKARRELDLHWRCCDHPNIVKIIDVYENRDSKDIYLLVVMECMKGGELFDRIHKRANSAFTEREAAEIINNIASAVAHLHVMNIAHRDLKPENLLYTDNTPNGILQLTDFGFAKEVNDKSLKTPCYTPYYVAPEVLGPEKYDTSCDLWSLGVIAYILAGGAPMSPGMKKRIRNGQYRFPDAEWARVSQEAKDLIKGLLKTDPNERLTIDKVLKCNWVKKYKDVPETPLLSATVLKEEKDMWVDVQEEMTRTLNSFRLNTEECRFKDLKMNSNTNPLLKRRQQKKSIEN